MVIDGPPGIEALGISTEPSRIHAYTVESGKHTAWVWSLENGTTRLLRSFDCGQPPTVHEGAWSWDSSRRLFAKSGPGKTTRLWSLSAPADAEPLELRRGDAAFSADSSFHPSGDWLATATLPGLMLWPLSRTYPWVISTHTATVFSVDFGPAGERLASGGLDGVARVSPLTGEVPAASRAAFESSGEVRCLAWSPDGTKLLVGGESMGSSMVRVDDDEASRLGDLVGVYGAAFSPDGRFVVTAGYGADSFFALHVWRTDTLETTTIFAPFEKVTPLFLDDERSFLPDGRILSAGISGLWISDPRTGNSDQLVEQPCMKFSASADGRRIVLVELSGWEMGTSTRVMLLDLDAGTRTHLASHGDQVWTVAVDAAGTIVVTGDRKGALRVGRISGEEPHLLLGHDGWINDVDIDPLGRWIASGGADATVRIWPMPDLSTPPLHTLPHDELVAKLKTLTNLRVVRDEESATGWTLTHEPFQGWETVPSW